MIDVYFMNELKIPGKNNQQNKKGLVYGTTDKQKKEFQDELYQRILGVWETSAMAQNEI